MPKYGVMMRRNLLVGLLLSMLAGCDGKTINLAPNPPTFQWAAVQETTIQQYVLKTLKSSTPYPDELVKPSKRDDVNGFTADDYRQVRDAAIERCIVDPNGDKQVQAVKAEALAPKSAAPRPEQLTLMEPSPSAEMFVNRRSRLSGLRDSPRYPGCLVEVERDERLQEMRAKLDEREALSSKRSEFDQELLNTAAEKTKKLLQEFAKGRYALLLSSVHYRDVVYADSPGIVDVTPQALDFVKERLAEEADEGPTP